jgi:hypothetical protein
MGRDLESALFSDPAIRQWDQEEAVDIEEASARPGTQRAANPFPRVEGEGVSSEIHRAERTLNSGTEAMSKSGQEADRVVP